MYGTYYLCRMKKILLMVILGMLLGTIPTRAQFNTVATIPNRCKMETIRVTAGKTDSVSDSTALVHDVLPDMLMAASPVDVERKKWVDRYLSVCYPLRNIQVTSPYGYREDPFTGKRKFHGGIDLHARNEGVCAMMEGVVVKVGQDKVSGKYVTLRHGNYTVSYCHLSETLVVKGAMVRPRDVVGVTGSTGRSTGEHLHITCRLNGKNANPAFLFDFIKVTQQECVSALTEL